METEGRPHDLAVGGGDFEGPQIARGIAPDRDDAPDVVLDRPHDRVARVAELGVLEVTVAVDDHCFDQDPAITMRPINNEGAEVRSRKTRSLPTASTAFHISRRFPATVTSSTGYVNSPFSIQMPTAPRE